MALFTNAILKLRRADKWPETPATIVSCTWSEAAATALSGGTTTLVYTYLEDRGVQAGEAAWDDEWGGDKYRPGDVVIVRVDPNHPARSYFPEKQDLDAPLLFGLVFCVSGVILILVTTLVTEGSLGT
jgi:hypothetical protein